MFEARQGDAGEVFSIMHHLKGITEDSSVLLFANTQLQGQIWGLLDEKPERDKTLASNQLELHQSQGQMKNLEAIFLCSNANSKRLKRNI